RCTSPSTPPTSVASARSLHDALPIYGALMQVVFDNLLGNAIKYSTPDTPIDLSARRLASGALEVAVSDEGPGIGASEQRQVFERSGEHTSELQSRENLVCRLLLEKKN